MLSEVLSWWTQQMLDLLPSRLRRRDAGPADGLVIACDVAPDRVDSIDLAMRHRHRDTPLGRFTTDETGMLAARVAIGNRRPPATILRLPPGSLLERQVALPLAAEQGIQNVVAYEMDRFTPFTAEEVYWTVTVQRRDREQGRLHVLISLITRSSVAPLLTALAQAGTRPTVLEGNGPGGILRLIVLAAPDPRRVRLRRLGLIASAAACALLGIVAAGLPFVQQWQALDAVDARIEMLKPRVAEAETLRRQIAREATGSDVTATESARLGDALQAIAALTNILPDDTYLTGLVLAQRKITMDGQSAAAARLIGALSADPVIRNAAFAAPVTRNEASADIFSIRAELGP